MEKCGYFVMDQRDKEAKDSECLENAPPYMEIKTEDDLKDNVVVTDPRAKWDKISIPGKEEKSGLCWQLGTEYDKKKKKLQQDLRLQYKRFHSQNKDLNVGEPAPQPQDLSLPIGERRSARNRLRDERNREYNEFLQRQAGRENLKRTSQVPVSEVVCFEAPASPSPSPSPSPEAQPKLQSSHWENHLSRRDAATLTETDRVKGGRRSCSGVETHVGSWGTVPQGRRRWDPYRAEESLEYWERRPRRQRGHREEHSSVEESYTDQDEEEYEILERRRPRQSKESHNTGRRERRIHHKPERIVREQREVKHRVDREEDKREIRKTISAISKQKQEMPASMTVISERSKSATNKEQFATGLLIGVTEGDLASQRRKDRYREDLLEQISEQKRNKKREKELELRVAATGAIDPEKQPDRIKQFGAVNRDYESRRLDAPYRPGVGLDALGTNHNSRPSEEKPSLGLADRGPPEKPRVAFIPPPVDYSAALGQLAGGTGGGSSLGLSVPGVALTNDSFHRGLSSTLGEMVAPRIAGVAPPLPPNLPNTFRTPYDEAYYYYGARNPLDPSVFHYGPPVGGVHPLVYPHMPPGGPPPPGLPVRPGVPGQHGAVFPGMGVGMIPGERSHQSKENLLSYQEALRQQIQEGEERRKQDREEKERYEAKLEAEMKAYDPWGRGGAGAPLRDTTGKLISDLHRMHRTNEDAYINPESRNRRLAQAPPERSHLTPRAEPSAPTVSGSSLVQPSPFARGNVFTDKPTAQQLQDQDEYKDYLQKQIEEKRLKEALSRERRRREEEKDERRLAEQRALMQQEFEMEQEKKKLKEKELSAKNEELVRQAEERRRDAERRRREEEEAGREAVRLQQERQSKQASVAQRVPSPPIPALQKKLNKKPPPKSPSSVSQLSSRTVSARSISASHSPPVPAMRNQLRATEDQPGVISELSAMRKKLLSEQRRLEKQLKTEEPDTPLPSRHRQRPPVDMFDFDMARLRAQRARRGSFGAAPAVTHGNTQNIREFNQLKYRDSASREEVRQVYPDPPADESSLDIQQQALLREQQRSLRTMRGKRGDGMFELSPGERQNLQPREKPEHRYQRLTALDSDSAFIDYPKGKMSPVLVQSAQSSHQPSAQDRPRGRDKRPAGRRAFLDELEPPDPRSERCDDQADAQSLTSATSLDFPSVRVHNWARSRRPEQFDDHWGTGGLSGEDGDNLSLRSSTFTPHRRVSQETVATEAWLRPGTSDTVKRGVAGRNRRNLPSVDQDWDGPSTYHG